MSDKAIEAAARAVADSEGYFYSERRRKWDRIAQAAITAYLATKEAEGFVMVPVEATPEMHDEGCDRMLDPIGLYDAYRTMIAARPQTGGE